MLKRLKDTYLMKRQIEELEVSIRSKDELIQRLEKENASLNERLKEFVLEHRDIDSKLAGMNYRLYELARENKIMTMNLAGARAQRDGMHRWIEKIRKQESGDGNK
ncbi:MAG: hypothetical protein CO148_01590 [Nitrospirae bacterium CG_4_9_14_3_um_filter_41_27]|nr:hypothetical protein [Nitrospirota bacterium]PJA80859.1 MAG: hypothetical protein CO148_01590 [Nitrospirae bacterium CG_4_9_14_3_um_filter_41_27]